MKRQNKKRAAVAWFMAIMFMANIFLQGLGISNFGVLNAEAATFNDINASDVFLKQAKGSVTCTLVANAMMVRRAAMMNGNTNWRSITESSMESTAWIEGVGQKNSFSYAGINVNAASLSGSKTQTLINLLAEHPEGIVLYNFSIPHAVLLTDYTNGTFYCADPSPYYASGRIPISSTELKTVESGNKYWYVSSPKVKLTPQAPDQGLTVSTASQYDTIQDITIRWNAYSGATRYGLSVWKYPYGNDSYLVFDSPQVTGTSKNIGKLPAGSYRVQMAAYAGNSLMKVSNKVDFKVVAHSHSWNAGSVTKAPNCKAEGVKTYTCNTCGATKTETLAKTSSHTWNAGSVTKAPSCKAKGIKTYTCSTCGAARTEDLPKTSNHTWDAGTVTKAPTYTSEGVRTYTCTVCGTAKSEKIQKLEEPDSPSAGQGDPQGGGGQADGTFSITYHLDGGINNDANPSRYRAGDAFVLGNAKKEGYLFRGWYLSSAQNDNRKITDISGQQKGNINLYARWEKINIKKPAISKIAQTSRKAAAVKFKRVKNAAGYEIVYAKNKKFKRAKKAQVYVSSGTDKSTGYVQIYLSNLKKGKYYFKVRAFGIDSCGKKVYGKFSKAKTKVIKTSKKS